MNIVWLTIIAIVMMVYAHKVRYYCSQLSVNLTLTQDTHILQALHNKSYGDLVEYALNEFLHWSYYMYPIVLATLANHFVVCYFVYNNLSLDGTYLLLTTLLDATVLTKLIGLNPEPKWLWHWTIQLVNTQDEINLEIIRDRLVEINEELKLVLDGKQISEEDLYELKLTAIVLSQHAQQLAADIEESKEIQNILSQQAELE